MITSEGKQKNKDLSSRDLILELQKRLKASGCKEPTMTFDSCFSSQLIADLRGHDLAVPVMTSVHPGCLAPGASNLWKNYETWCKRCDGNGNGKLTVGEMRNCIPSTPVRFEDWFARNGQKFTVSHATGPWTMSASKNTPDERTVFLCSQPFRWRPNYQGLGGRERIERELPTH